VRSLVRTTGWPSCRNPEYSRERSPAAIGFPCMQGSSTVGRVLDPTRFAAVEPVQGFVGNETFRLRTDAGETLYYTSGAAAAMAAEVWACGRAQEAGVLAPEVVESGPGYLISRALAGSASDEPEVLEQAGCSCGGFMRWVARAMGSWVKGCGRIGSRC
jgi:hypothetical protein